ncbi:MAG TPA: universal stress protein, partial [Iamia sp.]|nr:universal stress protein [Iamia sp.]
MRPAVDWTARTHRSEEPTVATISPPVDHPSTHRAGQASQELECRRVVVGVDGTPTAAHALEVARAEALLMDASIEIVWAWSRDEIPAVAHRT